MPRNADIRVVSGIGAFNVEVFWDLNDDPRPGKISKTICICVSHEAAKDFARASAAAQAEAYNRVAPFLRRRLAAFDPQHDAPKSQVPPEVKWVIGSDDLFG